MTESRLEGLLRDLLPLDDEATGDWEQVLRDSRPHGAVSALSGFGLKKRRILVAALGLVLVAIVPLAALAITRSWWFLGGRSLAPPPIGTVAAVEEGTWNGTSWFVTAYRSADQGLCYGFTPYPPATQPPASPSPEHIAALSCGAKVAGTPGMDPSAKGAKALSVLAGSSAGGTNREPDFLVGVTERIVERVRVLMNSGPALTVGTSSAPPDLKMPIRFFVVVLPTGALAQVKEIDALDGSGATIEKVLATSDAAGTHTSQPRGNSYKFTWGS